MDEGVRPGSAARAWHRATTRRALLAGGAAIAAAGTAGAIVSLGLESNGGTRRAGDTGGGAQSGAQGSQTESLDRPIGDPKRAAAHLLRRAGFGGTRGQIEEFAALSRADAVDRLINYAAIDNSALDGLLAKANLDLVSKPADIVRWWLLRMAYTARPLEERMTLIWHGLLTSQVSKIGGQRAKLMVRQNELYRSMALAKYDDLIRAVSQDPAMMIYLDTAESTKEHPNENYARELMELFTMGVGNYTETDVRESARAFTGWRFTPPPKPPVDPKTLTKQERDDQERKLMAEWEPQFVLARGQHDGGEKSFLGRTGAFDGEEIVGIIMEQPATGRFICTRLFTELANYNPDATAIDRLVAVWDSSGHDIKAIVRAILVSDEFWSERSYRAFVRSPIEFVIGAVRGLELTELRPGSVNDGAFRAMGQVPFEPPNVAGWPGGATWLSSSSFFARVNFLDQLLFGPQGRPAPLPALSTATTADQVVDAALAALVDGSIPDASRAELVAFAQGIGNPLERAAAVAYLVLASPEYQLT